MLRKSESSSPAHPSSPPASRRSSGRGDSSTRQLTRSRAKVLPARASDVLVLLSDGLRAQDLAELAALSRDPTQALWSALAASGPLAFTIHVDGRPAGIFGVTPTDDEDVGAVWMLGTDRLPLIARDLLTEAPRWLSFLLAIYPTLTNFVDERNEVAMRWLDALGVEWPYVDDFATGDTIFRRFYVRSPDANGHRNR